MKSLATRLLAHRVKLERKSKESTRLIGAWRKAIQRAAKWYKIHDDHLATFAEAARDVGLAKLDRGISPDRERLDRLMKSAANLAEKRILARSAGSCIR